MSSESFDFGPFNKEIFIHSDSKEELFKLANDVRASFERVWVCIHSSNNHNGFGLGITDEWSKVVAPDLKEKLEDFLKNKIN